MDDKKKTTFNVNSHHQQGGITAGQVNVGHFQRHLDDGARQFMTVTIPKEVEISVNALMGDGEAYRYAQEIHAFLVSVGYQVTDGIGVDVILPPPSGVGLFDRGGGKWQVIVGHQQ